MGCADACAGDCIGDGAPRTEGEGARLCIVGVDVLAGLEGGGVADRMISLGGVSNFAVPTRIELSECTARGDVGLAV